MLFLFILPTPGTAKPKEIYWNVWTSHPYDQGGEVGCDTSTPPQHQVNCHAEIYDDSITCEDVLESWKANLYNYPLDECLLFEESLANDQWSITCPGYGLPEHISPHEEIITNYQGQLRSMKLQCHDEDPPLGGSWHAREARSVGASDVGAEGDVLGAGAPEPLGAAPAPSTHHSNGHLAEYIAIPIACVIILAGVCSAIYCFCGKTKKVEDEQEPFQSTVDEQPQDQEPEETVLNFIHENPDDDPTPVRALGFEPESETKTSSKKRRGFINIFGQKKKKAASGEEVELGDVGFQAKSHGILVEDPDEQDPCPEEPLSGSLTGTDQTSPGGPKPATGPVWGDEQTIDTKTYADANDENAGYPHRVSFGPAPKKDSKDSNDLFYTLHQSPGGTFSSTGPRKN